MTSQVSRWDDVGTTIPAGEAKYVVDGQPVAEYDNKHNSDVTIDIGVLFAFMNSYNANTILKADVDDTPVALAVGTQTVVGRLGGSISAIDIGIADNDIVQIDSTSINNAEYAKFTAFGLLSRSYVEVRSDLNVEAGADVTDAVNVASSIVSVADKSTPVNADSFGIIDSAAANALKELTWTNIKATMKAYMDTLYPSLTPLSINTQTGTTYTLVLTDAQKLITLGNAGAIAVTIPTNASVAFPVGTQIDCIQILAGAVTFSGAGVTINSKDSEKTINDQWVGVTLIKTATDTWSLLGDLVA